MDEYSKKKLDFSGLASDKQEMVILVGMPASGKSTFAKKYFVSRGYAHVNQDTLGTKAKCIKAAKQALDEGKSVIVSLSNVTITCKIRLIIRIQMHQQEGSIFH